jgi:hypothetical protein
MRAPNGRTYRIEGPPNATDAQVRAAILRQFPESGRPPKPNKEKPKVSPTEAVLSGAERGLKPISDFARALNPFEYAGDVIENYLFPGLDQRRATKEQKRRQQAAQAELQLPGYFLGGKIAGEVAGTAPLIAAGGGLIAAGGRGATRMGGQLIARGTTGGRTVKQGGRALEATGKAIQSGGVGVRAPTRTAVAGGAPVAGTRTSRMALRIGGGGTAGVAAAALTDQELTDAALAGAVLPIISTIARRGAGFVYDALRGRLGEVRAADIMRNLIAENPSEIAAALRNAPDDARTNTAEYLASQKLLTPELAAATRIATASAEGAPLEQVARARAAGQEEMRATLRGGATGTEAMQNIDATRQQVREVTDPMRAEALGRADVGGTVMIPQERAAQMETAIADEISRSGIVRRMRGLETRSLEQLDAVFQNPEMFTTGRTVQRIGEIADQAGRRADEGIDAQLALRDSAAARREAVENLRAQGLQQLNIGTVVGDLRRKAAEAEFVNPPRFRVLTEFANNLERRAASQGGVIDATGLYELRKSMADTVADLLGPMDPSALRRRTAELIGDAKPLIDNAIEAAGGTGWRQYLNTFSAGMQNVERQQFARVLEKLPEARFEKIMRGDDEDYVAKFFDDPSRYDINVELFGSQLPVAHKLAGEIRAQRAVAATGQDVLAPSQKLGFRSGAQARVNEAFQPGMKNVFARGLSRMFSGATGIYGSGVAGDQMAREVSQQISQNAMRELVPGLASPQTAASMLGVRSSSNKIAQIVNSLNPAQRAVLGQALTQGTVGAVQPVPAAPALPRQGVGPNETVAPMIGEGALNEYDEFGNPLFDEYGNYIGPR